MLDIRRLHKLKTFAARGSIAATAQSLARTAGAVSQQLSALRREVGVDLLRPDGRTVALTEAGRVLISHADRIFTAVQEAESAVAAVKGTVGATVTLAALPSTVARIVTPALPGTRYARRPERRPPLRDTRYRIRKETFRGPGEGTATVFHASRITMAADLGSASTVRALMGRSLATA